MGSKSVQVSMHEKPNTKWTQRIRKLTNKYLGNCDGAKQGISKKKKVKEAEKISGKKNARKSSFNNV